MNYSHLFEASMLVCFGFSWPLNVVKAYKARTAKGTSLAFILLIITGYVAGISAKLINHQYNYVLAVYFLNLIIVTSNIIVYIRNKALDRKAASDSGQIQVTSKDIQKQIEKSNQNKPSINLSQEENYSEKEILTHEEKNGVILLGGKQDCQIPVSTLAAAFDFNFKMYNKSSEKISIKNAQEYLEKEVLPLAPEGIILHLGEQDLKLICEDSESFDSLFISLVNRIKTADKKTRIALVSIANPNGIKAYEVMNAHIKAIAESFSCTFVNLDCAKLWNPEATKAASDYAYSMGLSVRKPLKNVAEILYSYAFNQLSSTPDADETIAG